MFKCTSATRPSRSSCDIALPASDTTATDNNYDVSSAIAVASCNVSFGERYDVKSVRNIYHMQRLVSDAARSPLRTRSCARPRAVQRLHPGTAEAPAPFPIGLPTFARHQARLAPSCQAIG